MKYQGDNRGPSVHQTPSRVISRPRGGWPVEVRAVVRLGAMLVLLGSVSGERALASVIRVPEDYATIQAAVNAAGAGDVVRVGPGTYPERVTIAKSEIRLEADPVHAAVLDGITFTDAPPGITIIGTSTTPVQNVAVVGFRIEDQQGAGISLVSASGCQILSNRVNNTGAQSVVLEGSTFNLIAGNTLSNGTIGVAMSKLSTDNTVKENTISGAFDYGIRVSMVKRTPQPPLRNTIKENVICVQDPVRSEAGVLIAGFASGNSVKENRIVGNGATTAGIRLEKDTTGNLVKENILNGHSINVDDLGTGNKVVENVPDGSLKCP